ncbi:MAG: adenylosuccinate synthase [Candidatus Omnitrophica bacterium]|nr:adenylosuccinate synthase [Candidatus Omnitrophota bacterium]
MSSRTIVVGAQWGDEGKGKIIDLMAKDADMVVRFQGGNNAGHTVIVGEKEFIFHLLPSGVLRPKTVCVIGNGVVVNPEALLNEVDRVTEAGISLDGRLWVSQGAHIILPYHLAYDRLIEAGAGDAKIGTTKRGIGPCYADKVARKGIRLADLLDKSAFRSRLEDVLAEKQKVVKALFNYSGPEFDIEDTYRQYSEIAERLRPFACDTAVLINRAIREDKNILFEGAQGALLDVDHGTYPYVTSSNATAGGACPGTGVGPTRIDKVVGVAKAYTTRVGEGPFPTQFEGDLLEKVRGWGNEFGATTGRPRRCGWFDGVVAKHSALVNGMDELVITKLDVLDHLDSLKICTAYEVDGRIYETLPPLASLLWKAVPVYEEMPGWKQDTSKTCEAQSFEDLPENAKAYLHRLEELTETKVSLISVGSDRDKTFAVA